MQPQQVERVAAAAAGGASGAPGASGAANEEAEASGVEDGKSERENSWNGSGTGVQSGDARKSSGGDCRCAAAQRASAAPLAAALAAGEQLVALRTQTPRVSRSSLAIGLAGEHV